MSRMQTLQDILSNLKLSDTEVNRLSDVAKTVSIDCGKKSVFKELPSAI